MLVYPLRKTNRKEDFIYLNNRSDIVGELKSAEIFASHLPSLKAKELEKLT
jgi:hypothetical protein